MTLPRRTRRLIDAAVAAVIAVAVVITAVLLWQGSDARATSSVSVPESLAPPTPTAPTAVPDRLRPLWTLPTDPRYGAVATPYGTVVTATEHTVTGYDAATAKELWSYSRTNRPLCAIGSGDTTADDLAAWTGVHGVMTVFAKNGYCSQVTLLNPSTGARLYQRTSPGSDPGQLFFGSPYVGFMGSDYLELWRHDLVATIRYGNQPNPVNADGPHLGCRFSDAAVTADQLATIEHCGDVTNLVMNWPTPSDAPDKDDKGWDANHSVPKATVDLGAKDAVIVGITADRVAVVVAQPSPALVVYDTSGAQTSSRPVDIPAAGIAATAQAGITPSVTYDGRRYSLVGGHVVSVSAETVSVPAPPPTTTAAPTTGGQVTTSAPAGAEPETVSKQNPVLDWIAPDAIGLPARIREHVLVPSPAGLAVVSVTDGAVGRTIDVDRGGYHGRVDVTAVGDVLVEVRGAVVAGLGSSGG